MKVSRLFDTDRTERAVSPAIGVILMVAITVILAAVIASFVLNLGAANSVAPQSSFAFDTDANSSNVTITHQSGESFDPQKVTISGSGINESGSWSSFAGSNATVSAGESVEIGIDPTELSSYQLRIVWSDNGESSIIAESSGPDA